MSRSELTEAANLALACEARFRRNTAALARTAPDLADLARRTPVVVTYLGRARDGAVACRLETAGGERVWVGGTVVPRAAARQMVRTLALPAVGHVFLAPLNGAYCLAPLMAVTNPHQHLFVLERDVDLFVGTLMVTEIWDALDTGRVHLFVGEHLDRQLREFLETHPQYAVPEHLVTTSTRPETVAAYRAVVNGATARVGPDWMNRLERRLDDAA